MKIIAKEIRKLLNMPKGQYDIRVCAVLVLIVKIRRKLDYRNLSGYFKENSDEAKRYELRRLYGKSRLQKIVAEIDANVLQKIIGVSPTRMQTRRFTSILAGLASKSTPNGSMPSTVR